MTDTPDFIKDLLYGFSKHREPIKPAAGMTTEELILNMKHNVKVVSGETNTSKKA